MHPLFGSMPHALVHTWTLLQPGRFGYPATIDVHRIPGTRFCLSSGVAAEYERSDVTPSIPVSPGDGFNHIEAVLGALLRLSEDRPTERRLALALALEKIIRHRLTTSDGFMNDSFYAALAFDLQGLRDMLQPMATSGPGVRDSRRRVGDNTGTKRRD